MIKGEAFVLSLFFNSGVSASEYKKVTDLFKNTLNMPAIDNYLLKQDFLCYETICREITYYDNLVPHTISRNNEGINVLLIPKEGYSYFFDKVSRELVVLYRHMYILYGNKFMVLYQDIPNRTIDIKIDCIHRLFLDSMVTDFVENPKAWITESLFLDRENYLCFWNGHIKRVTIKWALKYDNVFNGLFKLVHDEWGFYIIVNDNKFIPFGDNLKHFGKIKEYKE